MSSSVTGLVRSGAIRKVPARTGAGTVRTAHNLARVLSSETTSDPRSREHHAPAFLSNNETMQSQPGFFFLMRCLMPVCAVVALAGCDKNDPRPAYKPPAGVTVTLMGQDVKPDGTLSASGLSSL